MGIILGKTQTKWGKCRPWLLWTSIPFGLSIFLMFTVPNSTDLIKLIYVFVTYNLSNSIVGTATWLSYNTLLSLLTRDQLERGMISTIRQALCPLIEVFITGITIPICVHFGNTQRIWLIVIGIYSIIAAGCGMICFAGTTERVQVEAEVSAEHAGAPKISAWTQFKSVLSNKYWAMALALWLLLTFYNIINGTDLTYYCQYILGNANYVGMISVAERIPVVSATFLLPLVLKKFGKRNLSLFGCGRSHSLAFYRCILSDQCNDDHGCGSPARHRLCTALRRHLRHDRGYRGIRPVEDAHPCRRHHLLGCNGWTESRRRYRHMGCHLVPRRGRLQWRTG